MKIGRFFASMCFLLIYFFTLVFGNIPLVHAQSLSVSPAPSCPIRAGQKITVTWTGMPAHWWDGIGIFRPAEEGPIGSAHWFVFGGTYSGKTSGKHEFEVYMEEGEYEIRYCSDTKSNGYKVVLARTKLSIFWPVTELSHNVVGAHRIGPSKNITVAFSNAPGFWHDYIAMFKVGEDKIYRRSGPQLSIRDQGYSGTFEFSAPEEAGNYEFRYFYHDGKTIAKHLGTSNSFTVGWGSVSMRVTVSGPDAQGKRKLTVQYSGAPGYNRDFIGLFYAGAPEKSLITHQYLRGNASGTLEFACPDDSKSYEFRMWSEDWRQLLGKTQAFIPRNGPPPPLEPPPPPPTPDKPFTLRAYPGDGKVSLEWTPPQNTSNVIGYNLYRKTSRIPYGSPITDFPIKGLSHTDHNVDNGMQACYYLKAVYSDKTESVASNEVCVTPNAGADGKITIILTIGSKNAYVNQQLVVLDVAPFIDSGRTFVPFRFVGESLGAQVGYTTDANGRVATVTYQLGSTSIILYIGRKDALVNGRTVYLDVAPKIVQGRTVIPLRFVTEALGCKVDWDGQKMQVTIIYPA
jgi:hypothetical protein